jgi:hypothetical protein
MLLPQVVIILVLVNSIFECSAQLLANADGQICVGIVCLPSNYNRLIGPFKKNESIDIEIDLDVHQIVEVDDKLFTVSFTMYFNVKWQEPRLVSPVTPPDHPIPKYVYVPVDLSFMSYIWVPDVYFYHLKSVESLNILSQFAGIVFF